MFAAVPLSVLPILAYNLFVLTLAGDFKASDAHARLTDPFYTLRTSGGGVWPISPADVLLAAALVVLFIELVKSTPSRRVALVNHGLSLVVFAACLAEMLLAPACATSTFFLLTLMVLLDVMAGFIVTLSTRRGAYVVDDP